MFPTLTGMGLATSAGLNAYIPLLAMGLLDRYTTLVRLPNSWHWLSNGWVLSILGVLLAIEMVADKVPVVDHVNDAVQTFIRPTSGGLVFGAASSARTATVTNPGTFFSSHQWIPVAIGVLLALTVHTAKATTRPVVNATTVGLGAPIVSTFEDIFSTAMSLAAILMPVLILVMLVLLIAGFWALFRRRARRRKTKRLARA